MRFLRLLLVALLAGALPIAAFAQSTPAPDLSSLIAQLSALEQQIASLTATQTIGSSAAPTANTAPASGGECPVLNNTLSLGSSGSDVVSLQAFLAGQGLFDLSPTGYFGTITQAAVAAWQEKENIVSGGDASSTGLGVAGPRTRVAIASSCSGATSVSTPTPASQCLPSLPPNTDCSTGWDPVEDANGCTIYYQCSIPLPGASATSTAPATVSLPTACPVVQEPTCPGTVEPFQTDSSGCVTSYECVL